MHLEETKKEMEAFVVAKVSIIRPKMFRLNRFLVFIEFGEASDTWKKYL